jgi:hypothetical protein
MSWQTTQLWHCFQYPAEGGHNKGGAGGAHLPHRPWQEARGFRSRNPRLDQKGGPLTTQIL